MSRPEYTWAVQSANGLFTGTDPQNRTNDIDIPTKMPRLRMPASQIYLGSVELPLAQLLVESQWNTLYFDEGIRLIVNNESELCTREFTVIVNGVPVTAIVPMLYNPIIDVDLSDPTRPIFTTLFDHALDVREQWNWGQPIQLVSTPLTDPALINLTQQNANFQIISSNQFQISNAPAVAYPNPGGIFGYVYAPPIGSPQYLAQITQAALNIAAPGEFFLTYDTNSGHFVFRSDIRQQDTCLSNPPLAYANIVISIPVGSCLAAIMGFGSCGNVPVPTAPSDRECKPEFACRYQLEGGWGYQCFSQIRLTPSNYGPESFAAQLNLQWNRFYFDGGCAMNPANRPVFVFSAADGTCISIPIEYGMYTPDTFAEYLQTQMNALDPNGNTYNVGWEMKTGQFCFTSTSGSTFGLEFNDPNNTFNPCIIGFDAISYRGQGQYCSTTSFQVPTNGCCALENLRFSSLVFSTRVTPSQGRFTINVAPPRTITNGFLTDIGGGLAEIFTTAPNLVAHGLQPEDLVTVRDTGTNTVYTLRVIEVLDAFRIRAEIGSVGSLVGAANLPVSFGMSGQPVVSLLWADQQRPNRLPHRFLGYSQQDALYRPGVNPPFISPNAYDLDPPKYVLMVLTDPNGATHTSHAYQNSNIPNVFAKIIFYPQFRLERNFPMIMYIPQLYQITKVHFVFYNPDHTLYQFHNKDWSCTLNFVVAEAQADLVCF
jgi:hypothetical protein